MPEQTAGYSGKPLAVKLGIKERHRVAVLNAPSGYLTGTLSELPFGVIVEEALSPDSAVYDVIQFFTTSRATLTAQIPILSKRIPPNGMIWVSWPKRAARVTTDLDDNVVREIGLAAGLVDVKVAAIDAVWSGLKFVYRLKDRA